ncbi:hypothetical protein [Roseococcus pinisoli]|uniref:Uncharacterized protein n=1 Tax=Roseococcus pinisoli TaxID=2835040 RepID=A0ABS5QHA0_9PROT|nr:hypothetical protein [Roseococcus pinisoli]MBS7812330.1 hypothetical protein [Roseococcus pinisoli]
MHEMMTTSKANNLAYTKKLAPLPQQGIQAMGLSKDAAFLFARIAAWYPSAKALRPGDPTPWIARSSKIWFTELDFTAWEWRKAVGELETRGLIERARGLWNNRCLSFVRPSKRVRTEGWIAIGKPIFELDSQNQIGAEHTIEGVADTDSFFLVPELQPNYSKEDGQPPAAPGALPPGFVSKAEAGEVSQASSTAQSSPPVQSPQPPFPAPIVISKPAMAMQVDSAVHPGAQHALAQMAKEGLKAMATTTPPPKGSQPAQDEAKASGGGVAALAQGWKAQQLTKGPLAAVAAASGGKSPLASLEAVWRAGTPGFTAAWSPKTKTLMKRFIAHMPPKTDASAVMASCLADWPGFRAFAKENYEGWKLSEKPVADVMALQIDAAVNWFQAEAKREELKAAAAAKAAAAKMATSLKQLKPLAAPAAVTPKVVAEKHVPITPEEIEAAPHAFTSFGKKKTFDPFAALKAKKATDA